MNAWMPAGPPDAVPKPPTHSPPLFVWVAIWGAFTAVFGIGCVVMAVRAKDLPSSDSSGVVYYAAMFLIAVALSVLMRFTRR